MMLQYMAIRGRSRFITRQWSSPWEVIELHQLRELPTEDSHTIARHTQIEGNSHVVLERKQW